MEARSEGPGSGSEFLVRLPIAEASKHVGDADRDGAADRPSRLLRVLIADDNLDSASSMGRLLEILGHEVRLAHDGLETIEVASDFPPDVVLMDIGMPRQNGYDAARSIRAQPWAGSTVLIALTGWGQLDDKARARDAGFDFHITKPADPEELRSLLESLPGRDPAPAPTGRGWPCVGRAPAGASRFACSFQGPEFNMKPFRDRARIAAIAVQQAWFHEYNQAQGREKSWLGAITELTSRASHRGRPRRVTPTRR